MGRGRTVNPPCSHHPSHPPPARSYRVQFPPAGKGKRQALHVDIVTTHPTLACVAGRANLDNGAEKELVGPPAFEDI